MPGQLWNVGVKVADVAAEIAFYEALGGKLMLHEKLATPEGEAEYAIVLFGDTRLFLTPKPIFEDKLDAPPPNGLTHTVFEVDDLDAEVVRLEGSGAELLIHADGDQRRIRSAADRLLPLAGRACLRGDADSFVDKGRRVAGEAGDHRSSLSTASATASPSAACASFSR